MTQDDQDFEAPILEVEKQLEELMGFGGAASEREIARLQTRLDHVRREVYGRLTPWQKVQVARHPNRPYTLDFIRLLCSDFVEIHGDRGFADDPAIVAGFAVFHERPVAIVGHQKGRDTREKILRNFGMPRPEGYRKALRVMQMAERFGRPILTFIDTPGAYPGIGAEERGQAEAIARNLQEMARLRVPVICTVTGEGGSGGALALGVGDRVNMLEHAVYSVISPEGCAAILWKDDGRKRDAAEHLRMTASDLRALAIVDEVIPEPPGGAHANPGETARLLDETLLRQLDGLERMPADSRLESRHLKFRRMGQYEERPA